jgi:hypothetical protein
MVRCGEIKPSCPQFSGLLPRSAAVLNNVNKPYAIKAYGEVEVQPHNS